MPFIIKLGGTGLLFTTLSTSGPQMNTDQENSNSGSSGLHRETVKDTDDGGGGRAFSILSKNENTGGAVRLRGGERG